MSAASRYAIRFAGGAVDVEAPGLAAGAIADFVCAALPRGDSRPAAATVFRLSEDPATGELALFQGRRRLTASGDRGWLADQLLRGVCTALAEGASAAPVFHAAALSWQGRGVIFPGGTAAGKSTLAGWLALQGWAYHSDELAAVSADGPTLSGLLRPLSLKESSLHLFASSVDLGAPGAGIMVTPHGAMIAPSMLRGSGPGPAPLARIIFTNYRADSACLLQPLSPARAVVRLMGCLVNARNLPDHGLADAVRLAERIPAYQLIYGGCDQLGEHGERLWAEPPARA
ncbi:MAG TPA: hypothetical protein PK176_12655 [Acidobacteriota bacterium]|nr:hypothetical protein [Acidobacteriota bacterium]HQM64156.1 hypothetical protein [Acidobacteriota bacterium]